MGDTNTIKLAPVGINADVIVWDEKGRSELVQIFISHDDKIYSLQFQYAENGALILSDRHGQLTGDNFNVVKLDYPSEYLTSIRGSRNNVGISSITFHTNLHTHGPFGNSGGYDQKEFCFALGGDGQFGGFYGTAANGITSIGVYMKPITTLNANVHGRPVKVEDK